MMHCAKVIYERKPTQNGYTAMGVWTNLPSSEVDQSLVEEIVRRINEEIGPNAARAWWKDGNLRITILGVCEKAWLAQYSAFSLSRIIKDWFNCKVSLMSRKDGLAVETAMIS